MNSNTESSAKLRQQICVLRNERDSLEQKLFKFRHTMKKGALVEIYTKCSTPNCRCQRGQKHGPAYYVNLNIAGKIIHRYIGKKDDKKLVESLKRYKNFKTTLISLNKINKKLQTKWQAYRNILTQEINTNA